MLRRLRLVAPVGVANLIGAVAVFCYQNLLTPDPDATSGDLRDAGVAFGVFCLLSFPVFGVISHRLLAPGVDWLPEGRAPSDDERRALLAAPWRLAVMAFVAWVIAVVTFSTLAFSRGDSLVRIAVDAVGTLLGGLISAPSTFLLVESMLRPTVAVALADAATPPETRTIGIGSRILVSWAVGSGIPLFAIAAVQVRPPGLPATSPAALAFLAVVGLVVGAVLLVFASRGVVTPVGDVRRALALVQEGDLDVRVTVDDGGEIGQLQAGVNEMVAGLRERRLLEELFGRHVGTEVARRALTEGSELGGELRTVTALFVDLIGSTSMAERRSPADVVAILNTFFETVVRATADEGGWVDKFEGDGALCVFGAPSDQPDHAARALRAARRMQGELRDVHPAGIGVSSGTVVAGNVGAADRLEYTVIGDPVNEAARLTEAAKETGARVLASKAAVDAAGDEGCRWRPVAELRLRGRSGPTCAYAPAP